MKKSKELMDNITYKIRNRDEISEQLVYIKVLSSEAKRIRKFISKQEAKEVYTGSATSRQRQVC